jgi:hypothetical protein
MSTASSLGDWEIRHRLLAVLQRAHLDDAGTVVLEEFGVRNGSARIDVATVNGRIHGYEIKSDRDSLRRLSHQVVYFNSVADRMTLVVGSSHLIAATREVPDWWGIMVARHNISNPFVTVRVDRDNPLQDGFSLVGLLRRDEAARAAGVYGLKSLARTRRLDLQLALAEALPLQELRCVVTSAIKARPLSLPAY